MLNAVLPYAKAVVGFLTPGVLALVAANQAESPGGSAVTSSEWISVLAACILTGGLVFGVPNKDPQALHQDESVQPPA
jgi:hypothetical protein